MFQRVLAGFLFLTSTSKANDVSATDPRKQTVSISVDTSVLGALVKLGSETHIPVGVVLDARKPEKFCEEYRQITVQDKPVSEFLDDLFRRSSYVWSFDTGVVMVRPAHLPDHVSGVLNMTFDRFGGMQTTMQRLGIILSGWIYSRLHPGAGVAGDILSSPNAEQFSHFEIQNASVEQILNRIISLGNKGIWLFRLSQDFERDKEVVLHTYSYKDDAHTLQAVCNHSQPAER